MGAGGSTALLPEEASGLVSLSGLAPLSYDSEAWIAALHYKTPLAEADSADLYKELQDVSARLCK